MDGYYAKCSNGLLLLLTLIVLHHSLSVSLLLCDFCVCVFQCQFLLTLIFSSVNSPFIRKLFSVTSFQVCHLLPAGTLTNRMVFQLIYPYLRIPVSSLPIFDINSSSFCQLDECEMKTHDYLNLNSLIRSRGFFHIYFSYLHFFLRELSFHLYCPYLIESSLSN